MQGKSLSRCPKLRSVRTLDKLYLSGIMMQRTLTFLRDLLCWQKAWIRASLSGDILTTQMTPLWQSGLPLTRTPSQCAQDASWGMEYLGFSGSRSTRLIFHGYDCRPGNLMLLPTHHLETCPGVHPPVSAATTWSVTQGSSHARKAARHACREDHTRVLREVALYPC